MTIRIGGQGYEVPQLDHYKNAVAAADSKPADKVDTFNFDELGVMEDTPPGPVIPLAKPPESAPETKPAALTPPAPLTTLDKVKNLMKSGEGIEVLAKVLVNIIVREDSGFSDKTSVMRGLAKEYNNDLITIDDGVSSPEEIEKARKSIDIIKLVFKIVKECDSVSAFRAGLVASADLKDGEKYLEEYLREFVARSQRDDSIPKDDGARKDYFESLPKFAAKHKDRTLRWIPELSDMWFSRNENAIVWDTLMELAEIPVEVAVKDGETEFQQAYAQRVFNCLYTTYRDQPIDVRVKLAAAIVGLTGPKYYETQVNLLNAIIGEKPVDEEKIEQLEPIKKSVLDALNGLDPSEIQEGYINKRTVAFGYFRLYALNDAKAVKDGAIVSGMAQYSYGENKHLLLEYLADPEVLGTGETAAPFWRDSAHTLLKDNQTKLSNDPENRSPMVRYGIELIGETEDECEGAPTTAIEKQCKDTIDYLYLERRKRAHFVNATVAGMPAATLVTHGENAMGLDAHGLSAGLGWMTPELWQGGRLFVDAEYAGGAGQMDLNGAGGFFGVAATVGSVGGGSIEIKNGIGGEYLNWSGQDENRAGVAFAAGAPDTTGLYNLTPISPDTTVEGGALLYRLETAYELPFMRARGNGMELLTYFVVGFDAGWSWNKVSDDGCPYSFDPGAASSTTLGSIKDGNGTFTSRAPVGYRCREGEATSGPAWKARVGLRFNFHK